MNQNTLDQTNSGIYINIRLGTVIYLKWVMINYFENKIYLKEIDEYSVGRDYDISKF